MFEFDAGKLIIIGIVALIVIGPKELPRVMRHLGEALAKMRRMAADFRGQFVEAMREAEIEQAKSQVEMLAERTKADLAEDPFAQLKADLTRALDEAENPRPGPQAGAGASSALSEEKGPLTAVSPAALESADAAVPAVDSEEAVRELQALAVREIDTKVQAAFTGALAAAMEEPAADPAGGATTSGSA